MDLTVQHAHPDEVEREKKRGEALALRIAGRSYRVIGRAIGVSHDTAHRYVVDALRELRTLTAERVAELRALEAARLDDLWWKLYPKPDKDGKTPQLSADKARALARISEGRRALFGLDLPRYLGGLGTEDDFADVADLNRLSTEQLQELERLTLIAQGRGAEAFGLAPEDEIFTDEEPAEPLPDDPPPALEP